MTVNMRQKLGGRLAGHERQFSEQLTKLSKKASRLHKLNAAISSLKLHLQGIGPKSLKLPSPQDAIRGTVGEHVRLGQTEPGNLPALE